MQPTVSVKEFRQKWIPSFKKPYSFVEEKHYSKTNNTITLFEREYVKGATYISLWNGVYLLNHPIKLAVMKEGQSPKWMGTFNEENFDSLTSLNESSYGEGSIESKAAYNSSDTVKKTIPELTNTFYEPALTDPANFTTFVKTQMDKELALLSKKGKEYHRNNNVFHNFEEIARLNGETRERSMWGVMLKHFVSIKDMVIDIDEHGILPTPELLEEKIEDQINYLRLLHASILDTINKTV